MTGRRSRAALLPGAIVLAWSMAVGAPGALAQTGPSLSDFLPDGAAVATGQISNEGVMTVIDGVTLRLPSGSLALDVATFGGVPGAYVLRAENGTFHPSTPASPSIQMSGLDIALSSLPWGDTPCGTLDAMTSIGISFLSVEIPSRDGLTKPMGFQLRDLRVDRREERDCTAVADISLGYGSFQLPSGPSWIVMEAAGQISMPLTVQSSSSAALAAVRLTAETLEYRHLREIPSLGLSDMVVDARFEPASIADAIGVLHTIAGLPEPMGRDQVIVRSLNAITLVEGTISAQSKVLRIYAPGAVPSQAIANFSRVGLSTMTGNADARISLDGGIIGLDINAGLIGLADIGISLDAMLFPYRSQVTDAAAQGRDLGLHLIPDLRVVSGELRYADQGLDKVVMNLFGVPAGRYIGEIGSKVFEEAEGRVREIGTYLTLQISSFLRQAAQGKDQRISIAPARAVPVTEMVVTAIRDFSSLGILMGLSHHID